MMPCLTCNVPTHTVVSSSSSSDGMGLTNGDCEPKPPRDSENDDTRDIAPAVEGFFMLGRLPERGKPGPLVIDGDRSGLVTRSGIPADNKSRKQCNHLHDADTFVIQCSGSWLDDVVAQN